MNKPHISDSEYPLLMAAWTELIETEFARSSSEEEKARMEQFAWDQLEPKTIEEGVRTLQQLQDEIIAHRELTKNKEQHEYIMGMVQWLKF